ncbi:hypothetical protein [Cryobacterium sp. N22]|uniref:hypothetical protein n=1 Tax=Cryobacterium sp. N22 TaxID=2048290 RepID=UPI001304F355|nr:hypothetical protein [Cryobacterium sp. N22]
MNGLLLSAAAHRVGVEVVKFATTTALWLLPVLTIALTGSLTYLAGLSEVAATGGDLAGATSATNPQLYSAQPLPVEYQGFDMMNIGLILMIALGALYAGSEYRNGLLRSSLIADPHRLRLFATRAAVLAVVVAVTAIVAMGGGTVLRHLALGDQGLAPLAFPPLVWRNIGGVALTWTVLALLAFAIGVLARNAILPLVVIVPLSVGLGDFLITLWAPARFVPPAAGASLYTPADGTHLAAAAGAIVLVAWAGVAVVLAGIVFRRRDA